MSEDIEGIEKEIEIELGRISVSSFEADDPDTEVSDEPLSDSETVSIQWAKNASVSAWKWCGHWKAHLMSDRFSDIPNLRISSEK